MPVKFKLGFTIDAETLFGILAKFLPVSDVTVEEIVQAPPQQPIGDLVHALHSPQRVKHVKKAYGHAVNIHSGVNAVIMATMADGAIHTAADCLPAIRAGGYSSNGLSGKLTRLKAHGILAQPRPGRWQLTLAGKQRWEQLPASAQESAA